MLIAFATGDQHEWNAVKIRGISNAKMKISEFTFSLKGKNYQFASDAGAN